MNQEIKKKDISNLVDNCFKDPKIGHHKTVMLLDNLMKLGFNYATKSGLSISLSDMVIPTGKPDIIKVAEKQVKEIKKQSKMGVITENERYNKIIDIWTKVGDKVADMMFSEMKK